MKIKENLKWKQKKIFRKSKKENSYFPRNLDVLTPVLCIYTGWQKLNESVRKYWMWIKDNYLKIKQRKFPIPPNFFNTSKIYWILKFTEKNSQEDILKEGHLNVLKFFLQWSIFFPVVCCEQGAHISEVYFYQNVLGRIFCYTSACCEPGAYLGRIMQV